MLITITAGEPLHALFNGAGMRLDHTDRQDTDEIDRVTVMLKSDNPYSALSLWGKVVVIVIFVAEIVYVEDTNNVRIEQDGQKRENLDPTFLTQFQDYQSEINA